MDTVSTELPSYEVANLIHDIRVGYSRIHSESAARQFLKYAIFSPYRKIEGSTNIAFRTLAAFKEIINKTQWTSTEQFMQKIRVQGKAFMALLPEDAVTANITRHTLKLVREVYESVQTHQPYTDDGTLSLRKILTQSSENAPISDYSKPINDMKAVLLERLNEFEIKLKKIAENLSVKANDYIHSNERILTLGHSRTVENFLKYAAQHHHFDVIVAECAPACHGRNLAVSLAAANIPTTVISDSAIFAIMSSVSKVFIGTQIVLTNGGLCAPCGTVNLTMAAKHFAVPIIVLFPTYKISPVISYIQIGFNLFGCAAGVLPYSSSSGTLVTAYAPIFDYIPPEYVTLFITNFGGVVPSYVYRLLSDLFHPDDYVL